MSLPVEDVERQLKEANQELMNMQELLENAYEEIDYLNRVIHFKFEEMLDVAVNQEGA